MNVTEAGVKLTYDDFVRFPEDGKRHELIDGVHYVTPSPNTSHQSIAGNLHWLLRRYLEAQPRGRLFFAPFDVLFSQFDVVEPDLLYLGHARASQALTDANVQGSPDLVIEIASRGTRTRDASIKLRLYERGGVREYWIVDPHSLCVRVYRRSGDRFAKPEDFPNEAGDTITSPLFPDLALSVADVFKDATRSQRR